MLYINKYKPSSVDELILPPKLFTQIKIIANSEPKDYIFFGSPGTGKTSAVDLILKHKGVKYLRLDERGVSIYETIETFINKNYNGRDKVYIVVNEVDELSPPALSALKDFFDKNNHKMSFLFTTNHISKIPDAVLSRFTPINFDEETLTDEDMKEIIAKVGKLLVRILKDEEIEVDDEHKKLIKTFIVNRYPDMRGLLTSFSNIVADFKETGKWTYHRYMSVTVDDIVTFIMNLLERSCSNEEKFREFVAFYSNNVVPGHRVKEIIGKLYEVITDRAIITKDNVDTRFAMVVVTETLTIYSYAEKSTYMQYINLYGFVSLLIKLKSDCR